MNEETITYERIKKLAAEQNLSLRQLSLKSGFKSPSAISRYKQGIKPTDTALKSIAGVLGVSVEYLLGKTDEKTESESNIDYLANQVKFAFKSQSGKLSDENANVLADIVKGIITDQAKRMSDND